MNTSYVPIAGTFSKDARFYGRNFPIQYLIRGSGSRVYDQSQRPYIDWVSGLGACILGYGTEATRTGFTSYVAMALRNGNGFSMATNLEYSVAEHLCHVLSAHVPGWSNEHLQVRWVKTGSDACSAAIRLARAVRNGKPYILSQGYHGWGGEFVGMTEPHWGLNSQYYMLDLRELTINALDGALSDYNHSENLAAIIVEYPAIDPEPAFWSHLRQRCNETGALLIMDEVVTGLRYGLGGACERYNIQPDLVCLGKSLGNGMPIGALVGPRQYMDWFARNDPVFVSSTNAGDTVSLAACEYVLSNFTKKSVEHIWGIGGLLMDVLADANMQVIGHPARSVLNWRSDYEKAYVVRQMAERGILMNRPNFPTLSHTMSDVDITEGVINEITFDMRNWSAEELKARTLELVGGEDGMPMVLFRNR